MTKTEDEEAASAKLENPPPAAELVASYPCTAEATQVPRFTDHQLTKKEESKAEAADPGDFEVQGRRCWTLAYTSRPCIKTHCIEVFDQVCWCRISEAIRSGVASKNRRVMYSRTVVIVLWLYMTTAINCFRHIRLTNVCPI